MFINELVGKYYCKENDGHKIMQAYVTWCDINDNDLMLSLLLGSGDTICIYLPVDKDEVLKKIYSKCDILDWGKSEEMVFEKVDVESLIKEVNNEPDIKEVAKSVLAENICALKELRLAEYTPDEVMCVGDVVQLKSGGPKLTVTDVDVNGIECCWFNGGEVQYATFEPTSLKKV